MIGGIKPCPKCCGDGKLRMDMYHGKSYIVCEECGTYTQCYGEEESAISDWNNGRVISRDEVMRKKTVSAETPRALESDNIELRPCPYCGNQARIVHDKTSGGYYVACEKEECYVHTGMCCSERGAIGDWNSGSVYDTWYRRGEKTC